MLRMDNKLTQYVLNSLTNEFKQVSLFQGIAYLNKYEQTIIFYYTEDGYETVNEKLRNGKGLTEYGTYLKYSLNKLEDYKLLCYRTISKESNLDKYYNAFQQKTIITEKSFLSCSQSRLIAYYFSESPLFIIKSNKGKSIEHISKHKNEMEILFQPNSKFKVLGIEEKNGKIIITLEEV